MRPFEIAAAGIRPLDADAAHGARERHLRLTKPPGSLGRLEDLGVHLAALSGRVPPPVPVRPAVAVFAGDHGVLAQGVTAWPREVTAQMVENMAAGGAAVCVLARQVGATVTVVDVGVATLLDPTLAIEHRRVRSGTDDLATGPAMTPADAHEALDVGATIAAELIAGGADCLVTGEMGIGNTTPAAALIGHLTGRSAMDVTGRGTGIDDDRLTTKIRVVSTAIDVSEGLEPLAALARLGGLEIAALAGFVVGGAAHRVPVVIDGVIALAALLTAEALAPGTASLCIAGHRSTEPGATAALTHLAMHPLLDLDLRLGEGSGAVLAVPLLQASARILAEMATFDDAGIAGTGTG